ncbi:hypothetical protein [Plasticicumulans acidivorans]|nr:hypothetical protein [Plasticicumulans acidivorans]
MSFTGLLLRALIVVAAGSGFWLARERLPEVLARLMPAAPLPFSVAPPASNSPAMGPAPSASIAPTARDNDIATVPPAVPARRHDEVLARLVDTCTYWQREAAVQRNAAVFRDEAC